MKVLVDLNVDPRFSDHNLLGVPRGWFAYATRSHRGLGVRAIERDYETAVGHAAGKNLTFLVYDGKKAGRERRQNADPNPVTRDGPLGYRGKR